MNLKKILSIVISAAMVFSAMSFNVFAEFPDDTPVEVSTFEELVAALKNDNANIIMTADITGTATEGGYNLAGIVLNAGDVLDGNGHKLTINGANTTWDCAVAMAGGTVKNLTIAGAMRGVFMPGANGDVVIDNCVFDDVIYTFNSDAGSKDYSVTIKNTMLNGWTSYSNVHKAVKFESCTFGEGNGYAYCRPYQETTFTGCEFNEGFEFDATKVKSGETLTFNDCTYAGEELSAEDAAPMFYAGGTVVIDDETVEFKEYVPPVAQIGNTTYASLQAAIDAAQGETVKVISNIELDATVEIAKDKTVTLDLNGKTITGTDKNASGSFSLISIQPGADLTINDTVGTGAITLKAETDRVWNAYSSVISNQRGKLTVNGGKIEHLGGTSMAYGIDNLTNGKDTYAETIINAGTIKSTYRAVRQFLNGVEAQNILTVNGGTVEGVNKSIWMQDPSANANTGTLTVGENAVLNGDVFLYVTEGSTEWPVTVSIAASAVNGKVISSNVPAGYGIANNGGTYAVVLNTNNLVKDTIADDDITVSEGHYKSENRETNGIKWCTYTFIVSGEFNSVAVETLKDGKALTKASTNPLANISGSAMFGVVATGVGSLDAINVTATNN